MTRKLFFQSLLIGVLLFTFVPSQASAQITVPPRFSVTNVTSGLVNPQDIEPGEGGAFGTDLFFIEFLLQPFGTGLISRVNPAGGTPTLFATVPRALVLEFGFGGDLFVGTQTGAIVR